MKTKKIFGLVTSVLAVTALASCSGDTNPSDLDVESQTSSSSSSVVDSSESSSQEDVNATYTYNYALSTFPTDWNVHTYQTATDSEILDYTSEGFYTFDYNEAKDGYKVVPAMADSFPVDVTSKYVGQYGLEAGDANRAWKISLRDGLKWQDGTDITAADFVKSAELLLNPKAQNYRADSLYSGAMVVHNASNYLKQGQHAYTENLISAAFGDDEYIAVDDLETDENGVVYSDKAKNQDIGFSVKNGGSWGSNGLAAYANAGYLVDEEKDIDASEAYKRLEEAQGDMEFLPLTKALIADLSECVAAMHGYASAEAYAAAEGDYAYLEWEEFCFVGKDFEKVDFSDVGVFEDENGDLVLVLDKELSGFYLWYNLGSSWLVNNELYESLVQEGDTYRNTYGSSVDTFMSYGPYKLTYFQADKEFRFEKNEYWWGYSDPTESKYYQTTNINVKYVEKDETKLNMFLAGDLDVYGLNEQDMAKYQSSDYTYYQKGASTFYIAMNPSFDGLKTAQENAGTGYNKTILTLLSFRQALSFATDRASFALATAPTNSAAISMFSDLIIADPENGTAYRTTEEAKDVVLEFWGLADEVGEGKRYKTKDAAIASISGYDLAGAKELFDKAYDEAIAAGLMTETDKILINVGTPNATSSFYVKGYDYLKNAWTNAVKGTKLEGKLEFKNTNTLGNGFADALRGNSVDLLFGVGWSGSALDPYNLIGAYTIPSYQYDPSFDTNNTNLVVDFTDSTKNYGDLAGKYLSASLYAWSAEALTGDTISATVCDKDGNPILDDQGKKQTVEVNAGTSCAADIRIKIFASCEGALLMQYDLIPLLDDASAQLKGMKIKYYTEEYVFGVGRGGIKYMTFNYTDAEWAAFVSANGGTLKYN